MNRRAGIALGANLGESLRQLEEAREALRHLHLGEDRNFLVGHLFESDPVDCEPGTPVFLNTVLELETDLEPEELLANTQALEKAAGRPSREERAHHAPRPLDLDILYLGDLVRDDEDLVLPHPRIAERAFVLEPLASIRPALILPQQTATVADLLAILAQRTESDEPALRLLASTW